MRLWDWLRGKNEYDKYAVSSAEPSPRLEQPALAPRSAPLGYTIEQAIELMRSLPFEDDSDLVLRVLRKTLRSAKVSMEELIASAKGRESALSTNVAAERAAIEKLEREINARRATIERLEADLHETHGVRERFEQSIQNETKIKPLPPEAARAQREEIAAAAAAKKPPPPVPSFVHPEAEPAAASQAPVAPKSSAPPAPKSGVPFGIRKPFAPIPHAPTPKPAQVRAPGAASKPASPADAEESASREDGTSSPPDSDDPNSEETAKRAVPGLRSPTHKD